jgi:hypothetical protein
MSFSPENVIDCLEESARQKLDNFLLQNARELCTTGCSTIRSLTKKQCRLYKSLLIVSGWIVQTVFETDIGYSLKICAPSNPKYEHPKSHRVGTPKWIWGQWVNEIHANAKELITNDTSSQLDLYFGKSVKIQCIHDNEVEIMKQYLEENKWEVSSIEDKILCVSFPKDSSRFVEDE